MPISIVCSCGKRFDVPDSYRGRTGKCTACGSALAVPAESEDLTASSEQLAAFAGTETVGKIALNNPAPRGAPAGAKVAIGKQLGKYQLQHKLGSTKSSVFLAAAPEGQVAVKVLPGEIVAKSPTAGKRFLREARALFGLSHPNLVRCLDAGEELGSYFLVMEYFEGKNLAAVQKEMRGRLPEVLVMDIAQGVAQGLAFLRGQSLVHRNIKPEHVLINSAGAVKLAGMGLLRGSDGEDVAVTVKGGVVGTPQYMSPEQARAADLDTRSDLYSLGMTLYVALTGEVPFQDKVVARVLQKLLHERPPKLRDKNTDVSEAMEAVVAKLVEKKPEDRYQTPEDLVGDLEAIKAGQLVGGLPPVAAAGFGSVASPKGQAASSQSSSAEPLSQQTLVIGALVGVVVILIVVIVVLAMN